MKIFKNTGYEVAIKGYSWQQGINYDGMIVGSRTCPITAIKIYNDNVQYRVCSDDTGWSDWMTNGQIAGTDNESITSVQLKVVDPSKGDFVYRADLNGNWTDTIYASSSSKLGNENSGNSLFLFQLFPIIPSSTSMDYTNLKTAKERIDYVKDSVTCIASIAGAAATCEATAGLLCYSAGALSVTACITAIETGIAFINGENPEIPSGQEVKDPEIGNESGDVIENGGDSGGGDSGGGDSGGGDSGGGDSGGGNSGGGDSGGGNSGGGDSGGGDSGGGDSGGGDSGGGNSGGGDSGGGNSGGGDSGGGNSGGGNSGGGDSGGGNSGGGNSGGGDSGGGDSERGNSNGDDFGRGDT